MINVCSVCGREFQDAKDLGYHLQIIHSEARPSSQFARRLKGIFSGLTRRPG